MVVGTLADFRTDEARRKELKLPRDALHPCVNT
jgi:hypothetical protein